MRWFFVVVLLGALGCGGSEPECRFGAECASGACGADGHCVPVADAGADASRDASPEDDASPDRDAAADPDAGDPVLCSPDHDGIITREEMPLAAGLHATFRIATDVTVDTAGREDGNGVRRWDLSGDLPGDHAALVETLPLEGTWFGGDFPGASYAARLSDTEDLLGVFEITREALLLRGVVSPTDELLRTELTYDPPVVVLALPIERGDQWSTESTATGFASGAMAFVTERYDSEADVAGILTTPYGELPVQRVHVTLNRTVGFLTTTVQTHLFVAECFGTVASIRSQDGESQTDFTDAAEVRRLAP